MIEQWRTSFQRCRHAHAVDFGQDIGGEVRLDVEVLQFAQDVLRGSLIVNASKNVERWLPVGCGKKLVRKHPAVPARQHGNAVYIRGSGRKGNVVEKPASLHTFGQQREHASTKYLSQPR